MSAVMPASAPRLRAVLEEYADSMSGAAQTVLESLRDNSEARRDMARVREAAEALYQLARTELSARHFQSLQIPAEEELHRIRHDLRNLLQNVMLRCELAGEDESLPADVREDIARIRRCGADCVAAVNSNRDIMASGDVSLHLLEASDSAAGEVAADQAFPSRLLVADDSAQSREMLTRFLSREGHQVACAADGAEALRMAQAEEFDLILLDIQMPGMNGFEVLNTLRTGGTLACTPVILISGMDDDSCAVRGIGLGADDFLPRPVNLKLLRARVNSSLERQRLREQELARYFTPRLARQLLRQPELLATGRSIEVSALFCDMVGFSRVSERLGPEQTIEWLSAVLAAMSDCVMAEDGVLVDYTGDQIMALWGAPHHQPDHADRACRCAAAMLQKLPALNARWHSIVGQDTAVSIGINTGAAFVGSIGTPQKFKFGALGNTVNLASRVQGVTRHMGTPVLLTEHTLARLQTPPAARRLGSVRVNNIEAPVSLYELFPAPDESTARLITGYETALAHCESGTLDAASAELCSLLEDFPADGPSLLLMSRTIGGDFEKVWTVPGK
jgi:adenylate cyclase